MILYQPIVGRFENGGFPKASWTNQKQLATLSNGAHDFGHLLPAVHEFIGAQFASELKRIFHATSMYHIILFHTVLFHKALKISGPSVRD